MIKLPEPVSLLHCHTAQDNCHYTEAQLKQAVRDAYEDAAKVCEALGQKYRDAYKNRTQPVDGLYNPHTDGLLTGAWECETEIRALAQEPKP